MDIVAVRNPIDIGSSAYKVPSNDRANSIESSPSENIRDVADKLAVASTSEKTKKKSADLDEVTKMTEAMNKFVQAMNANIRFTIHKKSNELMVQIIDQSTDKVLKEFPSHEFLDTVAAIRDYVGILLDKKI